MRKPSFWFVLLAAALLLGSLTGAIALASGSTPTRAGPASVPAATSAPDGMITHTVKRGETLAIIARSYGVTVRALAAYNGITNPDRIYVAQVLRIPRPDRPTAVSPQPSPTRQPPPLATPTPISPDCPCEEIVIANPGRGMTVTNPVTVSGLASSPFEQTVVVAVLDGSGARIGLAPATITGEYGQRGSFSVTVPFAQPMNSQPGRIQVFTESPRDGALEHLSSVPVMLQGAELDAVLEQLAAAVNAKDYAGLQALMGPKFSLIRYRSGATELTPAEATVQLRGDLMGPGTPRLDFSLDARALLGSRVTFGPEISHVVYSRGWGANRDDDAFLMIGSVDGQARWMGLLYVPHALIDYRLVGRAAAA